MATENVLLECCGSFICNSDKLETTRLSINMNELCMNELYVQKRGGHVIAMEDRRSKSQKHQDKEWYVVD